MARPSFFLVLTFTSLLVSSCQAKLPEPPPDFEVKRDIPYAATLNPKQTLDLFLPREKTGKPWPLIVFVHGGGWENGDKADAFAGLLYALLKDSAFAGASINYRLTNEAKWPEQIYDCKAAIRWLRGHASEINIDPEKIGVIGISAGGHLVSLLGTSGGVAPLDGTLGGNREASSRVQCVVNICGPSDLVTVVNYPSIIPFNSAVSCTGKFFGKPMTEALDLAREASPVTYVTSDDPPVLTVHGTKDALVPFEQAVEFQGALTKSGVPNALITGHNGGHVFIHPEVLMRERLFFEKWLLGRNHPTAMENTTIEITQAK